MVGVALVKRGCGFLFLSSVLWRAKRAKVVEVSIGKDLATIL